MQMVTVAIHPGSIEVIRLDKFGDSRMITGEWNEPVRLINLSTGEAAVEHGESRSTAEEFYFMILLKP